MAKLKTTTEDHSVKKIKPNINIDAPLKYLYEFERDADTSTRDLVCNAQQLEVPYYDGDKWNSKYNLPEPKEVQEFASNIYNNYKETNSSKIKLKGCWKLLYRAQGSMFFSASGDGFYGELYFNTENHYLLLAIKGTTITSPGDMFADIKNVVLNKKGGALNSAIAFGEKVRQLMLKFKCKPMLIITGHSLGGYLAQIITYTITYFYKGEDGSVQTREHPSDDFGIYTMVFDSPAALSQMCSIDPSDILSMKRFDLPITNFVKDTNKINSNTWIGKHSGQVLAISGFENLDQPGFLGKIASLNPIRSHAISNFDKVDVQQSKMVVHLKNKETVNYDIKKINSMFFSPKEFELLHNISILAPMCAELLNKLPTFTFSNSCLTLSDQNISAEEFIPRAHWFLSQYKDQLDSGIFDGKQIVDMAVFNLWRAEMLEDAHKLCLNQEWKQRIEQWPDGTKIGGFESYKELRFIGCLLHNTVPKCFHYDYHKFLTLAEEQVRNFATTTKVTLVLIVKDKNQIIHHKKYKEVKIMYLVLDTGEDVTMDNLIHSALDENSQKKLKNKELDFMGHKLTSKEVIGKNLFENLQIWSIYNFHVKSEWKDKLFYCDQEIASENEKSEFKSATEFAHELSKGKLKFVLISSNAGMGKSTALKQIGITLQNHLQNYWIVHLNLFSIQNELNEEKEKLTSKAEAIEFVRNALLADRKKGEVLKKVFDWKVEKKEMVLLFDSLDEICPLYRETAFSLLTLLKETGVQIVLTTRPHEGRHFKDAQIFSVQPIDRWGIDEFVLQKFKMMGKQPPSDISTWLKKISGKDYDDEFWSAPLILNIAINIYDPIQLQAASDKVHKPNIFNTFFIKSISNTLEIKFELSKSSATSLFPEKFDLYNKLIQILAICTIFHLGNVTQEFEQIINDNLDFINRFDLAKVYDCNKVAFLHRSFAEYLIAKLFVQNQQEKSNKQILRDGNQLKSILYETEFSETRNHICTILAVNPIRLKSLSDFIVNGEAKLLSILIKEDRYELYLALNDLLSSQLNKIILWSFKYSTDKEQYPLYFALIYARKEFVHQLVDDGALFEDILSEEHVLQRAIEKGLYKEVVNHFKSLNSNINEKYNWSPALTPLQIAVQKGSREMVEFLIEKGADVNSVDTNYHSALYYAIKANSTVLVELLIANKADSAEALNWAAELNRKEIFDIIYEKSTPSESKVKRLNESLFYAVKEGHLETVKHLLNLPEANPREVDKDGNTFLHIAAEEGEFYCMKFIFEYQQQSVDVINAAGETPLLKTCKWLKVEMIKWLLDKNANVKAVDNEGRSYLHSIYDWNRLEHEDSMERVVDLLVNAGAEINLKDKKGRTPLMDAFCSDSDKFDADEAKFLLKYSPDVNLSDKFGNTCLHHICTEDAINLDAVKLLLEHQAAVNLENHKGETPLHLAAYGGNYTVVELLLEAGRKQNLEAADGETILRLAGTMFKIKDYCSDKSEELNNDSSDESEELNNDSSDESEELNNDSSDKCEELNNESDDEWEESTGVPRKYGLTPNDWRNFSILIGMGIGNRPDRFFSARPSKIKSQISRWRYIVKDNNLYKQTICSKNKNQETL